MYTSHMFLYADACDDMETNPTEHIDDEIVDHEEHGATDLEYTMYAHDIDKSYCQYRLKSF